MSKLTLSEKISLSISIITLITFVSGFYFWFYKTSALPTQVANHEDRINKLEKQMVEYNTKIDLIYESVLERRRVIMSKG